MRLNYELLSGDGGQGAGNTGYSQGPQGVVRQAIEGVRGNLTDSAELEHSEENL